MMNVKDCLLLFVCWLSTVYIAINGKTAESNCLIFIKNILSPGGGDKKAITMGGEVILEYQLSFVQELSSEWNHTFISRSIAVLFKNFQVKIMGGAGLTSNLDRPNMPGNNWLR